MFKGLVGPQSGRTPRSQAEKIGTDAEGFTKAPDYFPAGGHPVTSVFSAQPYTEPAPMQPGQKSEQAVPFKLK